MQDSQAGELEQPSCAASSGSLIEREVKVSRDAGVLAEKATVVVFRARVSRGYYLLQAATGDLTRLLSLA